MPQPVYHSEEELQRRNIVGVNAETVSNVTDKRIPGHYIGEDHSWDLNYFRDNLHVRFHKNSPNDAVFSLIGVDASIANAFRRILLAEIPTLAVEDVFVNQNTSIIQDEVLAHRLGLVPLKGSKKGLRWLSWRNRPTEEDPVGDPITDFNTVVLEFKVECTWQEGGMEKSQRGETDPRELYSNAHVYASSLKYIPVGQQATTYFTPELGLVAPVHPDILLAKLRPGQSIDITTHAVKGIGADHAKFSPVCTASYRLLPTIDILAPILGDDARTFAKCFLKGVIGLEPLTPDEVNNLSREEVAKLNNEEAALAKKEAGRGVQMSKEEVHKKVWRKAVVKDAIRDTVSRECLRHDEFKGKVRLGRQRDHFIFSVESTGQWDSDELFMDSVTCLKQKCVDMKRCLQELQEYAS